MEKYRSPLTLYVAWHPENKDGSKYGEAIYNTFCRDVQNPLGVAIGIPVFFRSRPAPGSALPAGLELDESERTAVVLLLDDEMFDDDTWRPYVRDLREKDVSGSIRLFPVALSEYAFSIDEALKRQQMIDLHELKAADAEGTFPLRWKELKSRLLHDLCRHMFRIPRISDLPGKDAEPPVKLFISHAKADGLDIAKDFRNYVNGNLKLKTFFDANDIADARDFAREIHSSLKESAIVVFLSDQYSTREWCRIEVIVAKRNKSPLVVVNALTNGEKRSFPYLGNVPTIRYAEDSDAIVDLTGFQVLNNLFINEKLKQDISHHQLSRRWEVMHFGNPPELFNYIDIVKRKEALPKDRPLLVLYPDPPLGPEELNVLQELDEEVRYLTPSLMYSLV